MPRRDRTLLAPGSVSRHNHALRVAVTIPLAAITAIAIRLLRTPAGMDR